jgi:hypothetical protein
MPRARSASTRHHRAAASGEEAELLAAAGERLEAVAGVLAVAVLGGVPLNEAVAASLLTVIDHAAAQIRRASH